MKKFINIIKKIFILPLKYKSGKNDYKAKNYWHERFEKLDDSLKSVGHEGLSETQNKKMYNQAKSQFKEILHQLNLPLSKIKILEIGVGNGFYTQLFSEIGINNYTGIDITDYYFPFLKESYPNYEFIQQDITKNQISDKYDIIIMIDVIQHIVNKDRVQFLSNSLQNSLNDGGYFIFSGFSKKPTKKQLFYVKRWNESELENIFSGLKKLRTVPFRTNYLMILKKET